MMQTLLYAVKYQMITLLGTDCWNHAMFCVQKGRIYGRESVFNSLYEVPEFSIPSRKPDVSKMFRPVEELGLPYLVGTYLM